MRPLGILLWVLFYAVPLVAVGFGLWYLTRILQELTNIWRALERSPKTTV